MPRSPPDPLTYTSVNASDITTSDGQITITVPSVALGPFDYYLYDVRGRQDSHLSVGRGTIPTEFHKRIKRLEATILLEHFYTLDELEEELEFIDKL